MDRLLVGLRRDGKAVSAEELNREEHEGAGAGGERVRKIERSVSREAQRIGAYSNLSEPRAGPFVVFVCFVLNSFLAAPPTQTLIRDDAR